MVMSTHLTRHLASEYAVPNDPLEPRFVHTGEYAFHQTVPTFQHQDNAFTCLIRVIRV